MSLRDLLQPIYQKHGYLDPELLVAEGTPERSPLHHEFEWDNEIAGHRYRLSQAAEMIREVKRVIQPAAPEGPKRVIREYLAVPQDDGFSNRYEHIDDIKKDPIKVELLRRQMERDWQAFQARWAAYEEFWEMVRRDVA